jgi:hypothetical protein
MTVRKDRLNYLMEQITNLRNELESEVPDSRYPFTIERVIAELGWLHEWMVTEYLHI